MQDTDIISQIRTTCRHPLAAILGALMGGIIPAFVSHLAHEEITRDAWTSDPRSLLVAGGLMFSAGTVYAYGRSAFGSARGALGFTLIMEGVLVGTVGFWSTIALVYLIGINAIATGCTLALRHEATIRRAAELTAARAADAPRHVPAALAPAPRKLAYTRLARGTGPVSGARAVAS